MWAIIACDIFLYTLNISIARVWKFLVSMVTDLSFSNNFSKDDVLPLSLLGTFHIID